MNKEKDKAVSHERSQTQSENNQARQIDTTNRSTTQRQGMLQGPEKELNDAMSEQESRKTTNTSAKPNGEARTSKGAHEVQGYESKIRSGADARGTKESRNFSIESETRHFRNQRWKRGQFNLNV